MSDLRELQRELGVLGGWQAWCADPENADEYEQYLEASAAHLSAVVYPQEA